jgi:hypothetical protein
VRGRNDWKDALSLELTAAGLDASVLSAFRARLVQHAAEAHLFEGLLSGLQAGGLLKTDGKQRTEAPPILVNGRALNRLEFVGETLRAGLHALATVAPAWLKTVVAAAWFERYSRPAAPTGCLAARLVS